MFREELELTRRNVTPAQFLAYVRQQIRKHDITGICAEDIDLAYWKAGKDLNFDVKHGEDEPLLCGLHEKSISRPYEMQTFTKQGNNVFNLICEFDFWDEKTGTGYFYFLNQYEEEETAAEETAAEEIISVDVYENIHGEQGTITEYSNGLFEVKTEDDPVTYNFSNWKDADRFLYRYGFIQ